MAWDTWPTATTFKVAEPPARANYDGVFDMDNQPRLLQPVTNDTDLTSANGFNSRNLRPGDLILVDNGTAGNPQLMARNSANNGWSVFNYDDTLADA